MTLWHILPCGARVRCSVRPPFIRSAGRPRAGPGVVRTGRERSPQVRPDQLGRAADAAAGGGVAIGEVEAAAVDSAVVQQDLPPAELDGPGDLLVLAAEAQDHVVTALRVIHHPLPRALQPRRHDPQVKKSPPRLDAPVRLPVVHVEEVGDDAGAGRQFAQEFGAEPPVDAGEEVKGDDGRWAQVDVEQARALETNALSNAGPLGVPVALADAEAVDVDAHAPRATLGGADDDPAVAAAEVVEHVA